MIRIRTKMIIYSLVLVILLNGVALFLYYNTQNSVDQYNEILQKFFLLNEISQQTDQTFHSLEGYINT